MSGYNSMKKSVLSFLLVAILTVPLFSASMAAAAVMRLKSSEKIKSIDDIDTTMFSSEDAV